MNIRSLVGLATAWGLLTTSIAFAKENAQSTVMGDWHGSSICLVRRSACHDEEALYHVKAGEKAGTFLMQADKVVNGKPQVMGPPAECSNKEKDGNRNQRIVCLSKHLTEFMFALNQGHNIVAVDLSSTYPDSAKMLKRVG